MSRRLGSRPVRSTMVLVNVCAVGHAVYDVDCGSCRVQNRRSRRRPATLRRRHLAVVAEHDAGVCQLCGTPVDLDIAVPDPWAATLDHIVARTRGGSDHPDNLQLAHKRCNEQKADDLPQPSDDDGP